MIERVFRRLYNRATLATAVKSGMKLGERVRFLGSHNFGSEPYLIEIEDDVTVSADVTFVNHDGATAVIKQKYKPQYDTLIKYGKIVIHNNCFIGTGTIIMPGVEIGPNSIVGAGSIVTKDVPANSVYAGIPAKFICDIESYAKKCKDNCPEYDIDNYKKNKRLEVEKVYMR